MLPILNNVSSTREMISTFGGYNHNLRIGDGEFYDTYNTSSDNYPVLSQRKRRGKITTLSAAHGLGAFNELFYVDGTSFYYGGASKGTVANSDKQFAVMGAYVLIFPDKMAYNVQTDEFTSLENTFTQESVHFTICEKDGTDFHESMSISPNPPTDTETYPYWLDSGENPPALKKFDTGSRTWYAVETSYVKVSYTGIGNGFNQNDGIIISNSVVDSLNGKNTIYTIGDGFIVIGGVVTQPYAQVAAVTIKRDVPDMDFVTVSDNRCWGCSSANHEIYACKLGDPTNWNCFEGISSDSYTVTIATAGDFTGAITHLGYVYFFKEECIHRIYGSMPSNYQTSAITCDGVEKGSERSLVALNGVLYYKSRKGICCFEGSLPYLVSEAFGESVYTDAVCGAIGNKLYVSAMEYGLTPTMFCYDANKKIWHLEDDTRAEWFYTLGGALYFIDDNGDMWITDCDAAECQAYESVLYWRVETGNIGLDTPDNKHISKLQLRLSMGAGSSASVYLKCDEGDWISKGAITADTLKTVTLPIIPQRCDHCRLKISGNGAVQLYSVTKTVENGSEL